MAYDILWRKGWDSNPRYRRIGTPDFESGAFDNSATFPCSSPPQDTGFERGADSSGNRPAAALSPRASRLRLEHDVERRLRGPAEMRESTRGDHLAQPQLARLRT